MGHNETRPGLYSYFWRDEGEHTHCYHAEMHACSKVPNKQLFRGADVYVVRVKNNGQYGLAKPCDRCAKVLIKLGVGKIYYTTN